MIRPHAKSFTYTEEEIEMMKEDIVVAQKLGVAGVVLGVLNEKNEVDEEKLAEFIICGRWDKCYISPCNRRHRKSSRSDENFKEVS